MIQAAEAEPNAARTVPMDGVQTRFETNAIHSAWQSRWPALICPAALLLCSLITHPVAEIGMNDDFSYVKSAWVLSQTGHIVYNGWATAMLGWQLYLGALFAELFGASFTAVRASTLLVALATALLTHRVLVRIGVNSRNATVGTAVLVLSPLFVPLALSFMTDIGGLFCIVLCLYCCLRALQSENDRTMLAWLACAAASNMLGGTVRQIAWLGVLVMVPSTVWLLRRHKLAVWAGVTLYVLSAIFIFGSIQWFQHQPYSLPESLLLEKFDGNDFSNLITLLCVATFSTSTFLLPILAAFVPTTTKRNRIAGSMILGGLLCLILVRSIAQGHSHHNLPMLVPSPGNYVTQNGLVDGTPVKGVRPAVFPMGLRIGLTMAVYAALFCFWAFLYTGRPLPDRKETQTRIAWPSLLVLVVPFSLAYLALLLPRGVTVGFFDRYLLPLMLVGVILLLRLYQDRVQPNLPSASVALAGIYAIYAVAGTHDAFSLFRAEASAFAELRAAGVPATSIDGGLEQNGMTQIEKTGYLNNPGIRVPRVVYFRPKMPFQEGCEPQLGFLTPSIVPGYALAFDADACGGPAGYAPVNYRNWLGGQTQKVYIVDTTKSSTESWKKRLADGEVIRDQESGK